MTRTLASPQATGLPEDSRECLMEDSGQFPGAVARGPPIPLNNPCALLMTDPELVNIHLTSTNWKYLVIHTNEEQKFVFIV